MYAYDANEPENLDIQRHIVYAYVRKRPPTVWEKPLLNYSALLVVSFSEEFVPRIQTGLQVTQVMFFFCFEGWRFYIKRLVTLRAFFFSFTASMINFTQSLFVYLRGLHNVTSKPIFSFASMAKSDYVTRTHTTMHYERIVSIENNMLNDTIEFSYSNIIQ